MKESSQAPSSKGQSQHTALPTFPYEASIEIATWLLDPISGPLVNLPIEQFNAFVDAWNERRERNRKHLADIVECESRVFVNNHAALVEALKALIDGKVTQHREAVHPSGFFCSVCGINSEMTVHSPSCPIKQAEAALRRAEGGEL